MPSAPMTRSEDDESALPPLPPDHDFEEGDRVSFRVRGVGRLEGTVTHIDVAIGGKRYRGLAVLGDDNRYYELDPIVSRKINQQS